MPIGLGGRGREVLSEVDGEQICEEDVHIDVSEVVHYAPSRCDDLSHPFVRILACFPASFELEQSVELLDPSTAC